MKRDYGNINTTEVIKYLRNAYNNTDHDYKDPYYYQSVPNDYRNLKIDSLSVGSDANIHIKTIRDRIDTTLSVLSQFYSDVESTSLQIESMADIVLGMLDEVNGSMVKINKILKGLDNYSGKTITPDDIKAAGIDEAKCARLKRNYYKLIFKDNASITNFIEEMKALRSKGEPISPEDIVKLKVVFNWFHENGGNLSGEELRRYVDVFKLLENSDLTEKMINNFMKNNEAVMLYLKDIKSLTAKGGSMSPSDMDKLKRIHSWYLKNRFDSKGDGNVINMNEQLLKNCVDTYELLNPDAKRITDNFFKKAYDENDKIYNRNILNIKYSLYTCSSKYRDLIIYNLPNMELNLLDSGKNASCSKRVGLINDPKSASLLRKKAILNLDLSQVASGNCCSFFHEFGHGLDYLSKDSLFDDASDDFDATIKSDAKNRIYKDLNEYNNSVSNSLMISASEKDQIVKYIFNLDENPNIVNNSNDELNYPSEWSDNQVKAYDYLGEIYGYPKYVYSDTNKRSDAYPTKGWYKGASNNGIVDDVFGGMTNSKLCGKGHAYEVEKITYNNYKTFEERVIKESYYHKGDKTNTEFFAEVFEYNALNRDLNTTKKVFGASVEKYEEAVKKAYDALK